MKTFTQFLEAIRDKIGDYSGDRLQAMAAKDIAEEDDLPYGDVASFYFKPVIEILDKIDASITKHPRHERLHELGDLQDQIRIVRSEFKRKQASPKVLRRHLSWLSTVLQDIQHVNLGGTLRGLLEQLKISIKNLLHRPVKDAFSRLGKETDYGLAKMFNLLLNRLWVFSDGTGMMAGSSENPRTYMRQLERFVNGSNETPQEVAFCLYQLVGQLLKRNGFSSPEMQFYTKVTSDPKVLNVMPTNIKTIIQRIKERLG